MPCCAPRCALAGGGEFFCRECGELVHAECSCGCHRDALAEDLQDLAAVWEQKASERMPGLAVFGYRPGVAAGYERCRRDLMALLRRHDR